MRFHENPSKKIGTDQTLFEPCTILMNMTASGELIKIFFSSLFSFPMIDIEKRVNHWRQQEQVKINFQKRTNV